jgi:hypothetical protein
MYDELREPGNVNLVGGHINQIKIESPDVLTKKTTFYEAWEYHTIFNMQQFKFLVDSKGVTYWSPKVIHLHDQNIELKSFIPKLLDIIIKPKVKHMDTIEEEQEAGKQNQQKSHLPKVDLVQIKQQPALL